MADLYRSGSLSRAERIEAQRQEDEALDLEEEQEMDEEEAYQRELEENQRMLAARRLQERQRQQKAAKKRINAVKDGRPTFMRYAPASLTALLKDILDLVGFSLPGISFVVSTIFSILTFVFLLVAKMNAPFVHKDLVIRRAIILIVGYFVEAFLPGINLLPAGTVSVAIVYLVDKHLTNKQLEKETRLAQSI
jgi:hypothetical protein